MLNFNWKGAQFEGCMESYKDGKKFFKRNNIKNNQCQLINKFIDINNINSLIRQTRITGEIDFFSLDITLFKASLLAQIGRLEESKTFLAKYQEERPEVKKTSDYEKVDRHHQGRSTLWSNQVRTAND